MTTKREYYLVYLGTTSWYTHPSRLPGSHNIADMYRCVAMRVFVFKWSYNKFQSSDVGYARLEVRVNLEYTKACQNRREPYKCSPPPTVYQSTATTGTCQWGNSCSAIGMTQFWYTHLLGLNRDWISIEYVLSGRTETHHGEDGAILQSGKRLTFESKKSGNSMNFIAWIFILNTECH